jgi:putative ABC transport system substrate-binding protein
MPAWITCRHFSLLKQTRCLQSSSRHLFLWEENNETNVWIDCHSGRVPRLRLFHDQRQEQAQSIPHVGVLTLMHHPSLDQIYAGFKAGMKKAGYKPGKNLIIDYQNANGDQSNLRTMASKLTNESNDVLVGITTPAAQSLANDEKKTPIVLGAVTDPKSARLVKDNNRPGGNITGVSDRAPFAEQLNLIKRFMPHLHTLGVIYTSSDSSAVAGYQQIKQLCKHKKIALKAYSIANSNDLNQVSQEMLRNVDAVIVPVDNTIAGAMQTLVKNANAVNKPVFPAVDAMVKQGGVATYSVNQYDLGLRTAKMVVAILKHKSKPATTPIDYVRHGQPILNLKQAKKLHLHIPANFERECNKEGVVYR